MRLPGRLTTRPLCVYHVVNRDPFASERSCRAKDLHLQVIHRQAGSRGTEARPGYVLPACHAQLEPMSRTDMSLYTSHTT